MTLTSILSIVSAALALLKLFVTFTQQRRWMDAGAAQAVLKGLEDAEASIKAAREARAAVHDQHVRDPASIMREDKFTRPD